MKHECGETLGDLEPVYDHALQEVVTCGIFAEQVVFLTANHRGLLPLRELHSTDDT